VTLQKTTTVFLGGIKERFIAVEINLRAGGEDVKRQRSKKAKTNVGQPTKKPLSVRYAEVLRLRQAIQQTQPAKPRQVDRPASE
jgi:hypothetical protein